MTARSWRLLARRSEPFLLTQPWTLPLESWDQRSFVEVARGTHRHVVRFLVVGEGIYALKELPGDIARREYRLLREMAADGLPVVDVIGVVQRDDLDDILVTRYLDYSLPYRHLFLTRWGQEEEEGRIQGRAVGERLLDALSLLMVRMHLAGYFWGDCSLNNTLLKRDAGALAAYVVDMETGERHASLSDGQRLVDLEIAETNIAGGLMDVQAELGVEEGLDPLETAEGLRTRYDALWEELTRDEVVGNDERYLIDERIRRLNELGFHVDEVEVVPLEGGERGKLRLRTSVTEQGHHSRRLTDLTGIRAQEGQARALLNDLASYRSWVESTTGHQLPTSAAAFRWLTEVFEPTVQAIPDTLRGKLEPVEVFIEILRHKWILSEEEGRDIGMELAVESYLDTVLPSAPDEKVIAVSDEDLDTGFIGYG